MKTAVGAADVWVFRRDPLENKRKAFRWLLAFMAMTLAIAIAFSTQLMWCILLGVIGILPALFCLGASLATLHGLKQGRIELDGNQLIEWMGHRLVGRWNLRQSRGLVSMQWKKKPTNDVWIAQFGGPQHLYLKREWLNFETLIKQIEERSGKNFVDQVMP